MKTSKTIITIFGILAMICATTALARSPGEYSSFKPSVAKDVPKLRVKPQRPISTALPTSGLYRSGLVVGATHLAPTGLRSSSRVPTAQSVTANLRPRINTPSPLATRNSYLPSLSLTGRDVARIAVTRGVVGQLGF